VFVALGIQYAMGMRHIIIRGLPRSTKCYHIIPCMVWFSKINRYWTQKVCF